MDYSREVHRMHITKDFSKLKKKIKECFKEDVNKIFYYDNNNKEGKKICITTEEDFEIMLMCNGENKVIYLYIDYYNK